MGLISKIYKELKKFNSKKINKTLIKKEAELYREWNEDSVISNSL